MFLSVVNRVAVGLAAPILAILFYLVGASAYQHAWLDVWWPGNMVAAALLGAPLAVPVALLLPLRKVWSCLPLIAIAAAIGIEAQSRVTCLVGNANAGSNVEFLLMTVYVIPATFGIATVLLLKRWSRLALGAAPLAIFLVAGLWMAGGRHLTNFWLSL
jgi:hypothetical protein